MYSFLLSLAIATAAALAVNDTSLSESKVSGFQRAPPKHAKNPKLTTKQWCPTDVGNVNIACTTLAGGYVGMSTFMWANAVGQGLTRPVTEDESLTYNCSPPPHNAYWDDIRAKTGMDANTSKDFYHQIVNVDGTMEANVYYFPPLQPGHNA